jgi:hypothetical protein
MTKFCSSNNFLNPEHMLLFVLISFLELNVIPQSIHSSLKAPSKLDSVNQAFFEESIFSIHGQSCNNNGRTVR